MLYHLFTARPALVVLTAISLFIAVDTALAQALALQASYAAGALHLLINPEEDIALVLVAYGVLLEERKLLLKKAYPEGPPPHEHPLTESAETYGAYILMIGLVMEMIDQLEDHIAALGPWGVSVSVAVMMVLHLAATLALLWFLWISLRRPAR